VFPDTLRENLLMGRVADEEALKAACASADFSVVLNRLPMGLETPIGSGGFKLSRSERQRLGLARAFVVPPAVLLFDEPTRSLDGPSSRRVLETLVGLATRSTVVVAADAVPPTVSPHTVTALDTLGGLADEQGAVAVSTAPAMASEVPQ
jgi:ABC-type multidrug transport system fused ATPase/permease subunit